MYTHHFGLNQDPFSIAPDPRYLFMSERHREALAHLLYGVSGSSPSGGGSGGGFVLLTGDIGTGKTTICRCFLEQIPPNCQVAYIFNPKLSVIDLLQSICEEFHIKLSANTLGAPTIKGYIDALNTFLLQRHADGQSCVLIIDEAQNLASDVLEQLRLLTNLETNERKLLQIVLIGQPELRDMLARPELEQLAQRVIARFHLDALSAAESAHYISHRLGVAGHTGALPFEPTALRRIHRLTQGVPRRMNLLCGRALLGAWASGQQRVNRKVVDKAAAEVFGASPQPAVSATRQRIGYLLAAMTLMGVVLVAGLLAWPQAPKPGPTLPAVSQPQPAASKPNATAAQTQTPVSAPQDVAIPVPLPIENIQTLWPQLPGNASSAWHELAPVWKLSSTDWSPCEPMTDTNGPPVPSGQALQCFHGKQLTVPLLRQLNRPGVLTLQAGQGAPVFAVLVGLTDQTATLQLAGRLRQVRLIGLSQVWRGEFATYWQAPAGYRANLPNDSTGPALEWLAQRLSQLDGTALAPDQPQALDTALRTRVRGFQRARGITADGHPGPMTFIQIDSATNRQVPHLLTLPH